MYFDKDPQLQDMCILDPQWLIEVFATLFTTSHNFGELGFLKDTDFLQIWRKFPNDIHVHLLHLLEKFEIALRISSEVLNTLTSQGVIPCTISSPRALVMHRNTKIQFAGCLVPALFPLERPLKVSDLWSSLSEKANPQPYQIDRIYRFTFLAEGFFSRLLAHVFSRYQSSVIAIWKTGILAHMYLDPEGLVLLEQIFQHDTRERSYK